MQSPGKANMPQILIFAHQASPEYKINISQSSSQVLEFSSFSSRSQIASPVPCRICLQITAEALISPCQCKGTLSFIHGSCLKSWISTQTPPVANCELCKAPYKVSLSYKLRCKIPKYLCVPLSIIAFIVLFILSCLLFMILEASFQDPLIFGLLSLFSMVGLLLTILSIYLVASECLYKEINTLTTDNSLDQTSN